MIKTVRLSQSIVLVILFGVGVLLSPTVLSLESTVTHESKETVESIVRKLNYAEYYAGNDARAEARFTIFDKNKRKQVRSFVILRHSKVLGGDQQYLLRFNRPADIAGTVYLVEKHIQGDDGRWLYLPGLDLVRRIASGDKRASFVGSHLLYEDVSGRNVASDSHELVKEDKKHYFIRSVPKDPNTVEFSYYFTSVDKESFLPIKREYFNGQNSLIRSSSALKILNIEGVDTIVKLQVNDLLRGEHTIVDFRHINYNLDFPKDVFSERSLRNPPRKWLKRAK